MRRSLFKSKLHRVTITDANLAYEGSITIDESLMRAADIVAYEHVHVWNASNGARLETYVIPGPAGSGTICLNGAAARHAQPGDIAIIATFAEVEEADVASWEPTVVLVDDENRIVSANHKEQANTVAARATPSA
jgi:aspartate 1-decarboxylase